MGFWHRKIYGCKFHQKKVVLVAKLPLNFYIFITILDVTEAINEQVETITYGRLFAVIHLNGQQFKITNEDLLLIRTNDKFPDVGARLVLEKVGVIS